MQRHQLHAIVAGFGLTFAGFQRGVGEKGDQFGQRGGFLVVSADEPRRHRHQFVEVVGARIDRPF